MHGLFLDGCAWSAKENRLVDAEPKKLFHPLPVLYITAVLVRQAMSVYVSLFKCVPGCQAGARIAGPTLPDDHQSQSSLAVRGMYMSRSHHAQL